MKTVLHSLFLLAILFSLNGKLKAQTSACGAYGARITNVIRTGCTYTFDLSWTQNSTNGNKWTFIHLWKSQDYQMLPYNSTQTAPTASQLSNSIGTLIISNSGQPTISINGAGSIYGIGSGVTLLNGQLQPVTVTNGSYLYKLNNIVVNVPNCSGSLILEGDLWSSNSSNGNVLQCVSTGFFGTAANIALPVSFLNFSSSRKNNVVELTWKTASEQNNRGFYIQRQTTGEWENIAFVFSASLNGNSSNVLTYAFKDENSYNGVTKYRIQQVDLDGKTSYSEIRSVDTQRNIARTKVYPNPSATGNVTVNLTSGANLIMVSDVLGNKIKEMKVTVSSVDILGLARGIYTISVVNEGNGIKSAEKIIIL